MSIRQLPDDVADKIKSYSTITSLHEVVNGLVKNSLDAGASKISVAVDYSRGNCTVEDDGEGISAEEFGANGGLAKLHSMYELHWCIQPMLTRRHRHITISLLPRLPWTSW